MIGILSENKKLKIFKLLWSNLIPTNRIRKKKKFRTHSNKVQQRLAVKVASKFLRHIRYNLTVDFLYMAEFSRTKSFYSSILETIFYFIAMMQRVYGLR